MGTAFVWFDEIDLRMGRWLVYFLNASDLYTDKWLKWSFLCNQYLAMSSAPKGPFALGVAVCACEWEHAWERAEVQAQWCGDVRSPLVSYPITPFSCRLIPM